MRAEAAAQASVFFAAAGALGLVNDSLPGTVDSRAMAVTIDSVVLLLGIAGWLLPWQRWHHRVTLALVPLAFTLIVLSHRLGGAPPTIYGVWFVVVFAWIGTWHPPRTAMAFAPLAAVAYVVPFLTGGTTPPGAIESVGVAIPAAVVVGEAMAATVEALRRSNRSQAVAAAALEVANLTDDLTGIGNRRFANALLDSLQPGDTLVVLDLDHFKGVNDRQGHAHGDLVLTQLGDYLRGAIRDSDAVARFGGEEFVVVLRGPVPSADDLVDRLLHGWRARRPATTMSAGVAVHRAGRTPEATFGDADTALYQAKRGGRDRLAVFASA